MYFYVLFYLYLVTPKQREKNVLASTEAYRFALLLSDTNSSFPAICVKQSYTMKEII